MPHGGVSPARRPSKFPGCQARHAWEWLGVRGAFSHRDNSPGFADHRSLKGLPAGKSTDSYLILTFPWFGPIPAADLFCLLFLSSRTISHWWRGVLHLPRHKYLSRHSPCLALVLLNFLIFSSLHSPQHLDAKTASYVSDTPTECQEESWLPSRTPRECLSPSPLSILISVPPPLLPLPLPLRFTDTPPARPTP